MLSPPTRVGSPHANETGAPVWSNRPYFPEAWSGYRSQGELSVRKTILTTRSSPLELRQAAFLPWLACLRCVLGARTASAVEGLDEHQHRRSDEQACRWERFLWRTPVRKARLTVGD